MGSWPPGKIKARDSTIIAFLVLLSDPIHRILIQRLVGYLLGICSNSSEIEEVLIKQFGCN